MTSPERYLLTGARFLSGIHSPAGPGPHALSIAGGRILDLGPALRVAADLGQDYRHLDLSGLTVTPGLIDCHVHLAQTGLDLLGLDLRGTTSIGAVLEAISGSAGPYPVVRAWGFDPEELAEGCWPTLEQLDSLGRPVFLGHAEIHACMVNTAAARILNLAPATTPLLGRANSAARRRLGQLVEPHTRRAAIRLAAAAAAEAGITTLHALEGGELFGPEDLEAVLELAGSLPVELVIYPQLWEADRARAMGLDRLGGCLLLDGSPGVRTAAMYGGYVGEPGNRGHLYQSQERVDAMVRDAARADLQLALHASGERAIAQVLSAVERAGPFRLPPRIEHFEVPAPGQARQAADLGVVLSVQPAFDHFWSHEYIDVLGVRRGSRANPLASCLRAGAVLAGGSDSSVTPMDPLLGMHAALNHSRPQERLDVQQALDLFTAGAAVAGCTPDRGSLKPGLRADLTLLQGQLDRPREARVRGRFVGGIPDQSLADLLSVSG